MVIGQCLLLAALERLDLRLPKRGKITLSGLVKGYVAWLAVGKSAFEAIETFRQDPFFRAALGRPWVPGSVWRRQPLAVHAAVIRDDTDDWSVRLLRRSGAPVTADDGDVCLDFDTFVMDHRGPQKACVGRTYQGVDGDTPIAAYLGNAGWCLGLERRPGVPHSALETHDFLARVLPRAQALTPGQAVLARSDSGVDAARLRFPQADERRAGAAPRRPEP